MENIGKINPESPPSRRRGLKFDDYRVNVDHLVASFAEAWIEIGLVEALPQIVGCRLLRGGVD